jgi:uncharacterized protein YndB with AHSA1/START domain
MTSSTGPGPRILGSLRSADDKGIVHLEDRFETDVDNLWSALTDPGRLARWYGQVEGNLRPGGEFRARVFASGWEGTGRVDACEPPRRLLVRSKEADAPDEEVIEATLTADGGQTILVLDQRGLAPGPARRLRGRVAGPRRRSRCPHRRARARRPGAVGRTPARLSEPSGRYRLDRLTCQAPREDYPGRLRGSAEGHRGPVLGPGRPGRVTDQLCSPSMSSYEGS